MPTSHSVVFSPRAKQALKRLDRAQAKRLFDAATLLGINPYPPKSKALSGFESLRRVRVGDYRIVYAVDDGKLIVLVVNLGHRREIYRQINR